MQDISGLLRKAKNSGLISYADVLDDLRLTLETANNITADAVE